MTDFNHVPASNELIEQNLYELREQSVLEGKPFSYTDELPSNKAILAELKNKAEIDYEKCSELLFKLISQVINHYTTKYGEDGMKNIVMLNKRDIANRIYLQMMKEEHF